MTSEHRRYGGTALEEQSKRAFEESVAGLDAGTRARLAAARRAAVERARAPRRAPTWLVGGRGLIPVGALAAAIVAAVLVGRDPAVPGSASEAAVLGDLEILAAEEDFEMLEDLEFYSWLGEQPEMESTDGIDDTIG